MFTFSSARPTVWVLVALLTAATGLVAYDVAVAADLATVPDAKNSDSTGTLKIKPDKHDFGKVIVPLTSAPVTGGLPVDLACAGPTTGFPKTSGRTASAQG